MSPLVLITLFTGAMVLVGLGILVAAWKSAPEGYEDAEGFHTLNSGNGAYRSSGHARVALRDVRA